MGKSQESEEVMLLLIAQLLCYLWPGGEGLAAKLWPRVFDGSKSLLFFKVNIGVCYEVVLVWEINWTSSSHNYSVIEEMKNKPARQRQKKTTVGRGGQASVKMIIHTSNHM